jgi:hypothetical protein
MEEYSFCSDKVIICHTTYDKFGRLKMAKQTVMRSVRISRELDNVLRRDAENRGISFSALVSEIFTKYAEWDRLANKFGVVTQSRSSFRGMWEIVGKEKAVSMGKEGGSRAATEVAQFWFKRLNTRSFFKLIELFAKYTKSFEYEVESRDEREYMITVHHDINETYSIFLKNWFESAIQIFVGATPSTKVSLNSIVVTFRESHT